VNSGTKIAELRRSLVGQITPSALQPAEPIMRYDYGSAGFGNSGEDATDFPHQQHPSKPPINPAFRHTCVRIVAHFRFRQRI
jgi:hypothetical protein